MKQPKLNDLTIDHVGTRKLRAQMKKARNIKITINIDEQSLARVRKGSGQSAIPYQQILSQILKEAAFEKGEARSRLDRIEREIEKLKRQSLPEARHVLATVGLAEHNDARAI